MGERVLETPRLILRRWKQEDARDLYEQAKNPHIGPPAGWPPHKSIEDSQRVIQDVFSGDEAYAICLRTNGKPIGAIELIPNSKSTLTDRDDECELGYWIGESFWGQGLVPEAAKEMLRRAFEDLGMHAVWCGYYEGNMKSKRVQEKLGFKAFSVTPDVDVPLMGEKRTGHENVLTREEWERSRRQGR